jgi:hypothetical protein
MFENPKICQPAPTEREDFILVYLQARSLGIIARFGAAL